MLLPQSVRARTRPSTGSTIHATATEMSSAATWLGMRMPAPRPMSAQRPRTSSERASVRQIEVSANGRDALGGQHERARADGAGEREQAVEGADGEERDDLGAP